MVESNAFYKLSYGLYVISSAFEGKDSGCVVNTLQQVTSKPERLSVAVNKQNYTAQIIGASGVFTASVLVRQAEMELIRGFGFRSSKDVNKFNEYRCRRDSNGVLYLTEQTAARFSCTVEQTVDVGTHIIFIGAVTEGECLSDEDVMTYAYYHSVKNGMTPPNAPSYREVSQSMGWRCTICGYVYEGDVLPADFECPVCGAPAAVFEKIASV